MWAENLRHWVEETGSTGIEVLVYEGFYALVIDERLPPGYITKLCFSGCYQPHLVSLRDMCERSGEDLSGYICGCEGDDDSPYLTGRGEQEGDDWVDYKRCQICGRQWEIKRYPHPRTS